MAETSESQKGPEMSSAPTDNFTNLDVDLSLDDVTIDDDEFDIPELETAPTLDSILNENDEPFEVDAPSLSLFSQAPDGSTSVSEPNTPSRSPQKLSRKKSVQYPVHGSIIRHVVLKNISSQVMSASDRVQAGSPTAMAISQFIAVGTSHGLILVFDPNQVLKWCLGSTALGTQYGAVSALGINNDCTRLLAGFARGQITMWDLTNGKLLRTITDAHPPGSAVLHIQFSDDPTMAICSDSGGSVFELSFRRVMGMRTCESRCLFSGSRGEMATIAPLHMNTVVQHPMKDMALLAMATLSKIFLVAVRPKLTVLFTKQLKGDPTTLPLLAWQFVVIQSSDVSRVVDPVLASARTDMVYFHQVLYNDEGLVKVLPLQSINLPYSLIALHWFNSKTLVTVDTTERLHLVDVRTEEELEVLDLVDIELVYSSSHFKSLATGGNVSKAMALAGERACYQSIASHKGQVVILGTKSLHVMTTRQWHERIEILVKDDKYKAALALAHSFYNGKAKAVVGLYGNIDTRRQTVAQKILDLLFTFVDVSMKQGPLRGAIHLLEEHFQRVVPVCVDYCQILGRKDILFGPIYDKFQQDSIAKGVFLECLEPYILNDSLTSITPVVMKDFVDHYKTRMMIHNVEACIVHMDIASLDIHQVVSLCWAHGLYDAIIYVYNKGMNDYITPLEDLLQVLGQAVRSGKQLTDQQIKLGNKLLVYISCCLAGRAYPLGDIPSHLAKSVKEGVWKCLTALHTKQANEEEHAFPYLRTLLHFDTREFLNVLALAFEEPEFASQASSYAAGLQSKQRIVDILLQVMVESIEFSPAQVGCLFTFLARQMAKNDNNIIVNRLLFEQVLEFLSNPDDETRHEEREQALLQLVNAGGMEQVDQQKLLRLAEGAKFYRVTELLYEKRRQFDRILLCYLRDPSRKLAVFSYINNVMIESCYTEPEKEAVQNQALENLQDLVAIDSKETAQLVVKMFASSLEEVIDRLADRPRLQYDFLQGVFEYRDATSTALAPKESQYDPYLHEKYIDLMCQFNPSTVHHYIRNVEGYRLEETLQIVRRHKIADATAYLLEMAGDVQGAFGIMLESLSNSIRNLSDSMEAGKGTDKAKDPSVAICSMQAGLVVIIQLCQRSSAKLDEPDREALWFPLLDLMMASQRKLKPSLSDEHFEAFKDLTRHVLNSMMGYIALPAVLQKIMQDPTYSTGKFGEIKELILGMLDTYNYEKTLLRTTNSLLAHDLYWSLHNLTQAVNRGLIPRKEVCFICNRNYVKVSEDDTVVVFSCGHTYHTSCLHTSGCSSMIEGRQHWMCFQCYSTRRTGKARMVNPRKSQHFASVGGEKGSSERGAVKKGGGIAGATSGAAEKVVQLDLEQIASLDMLRKRLEGPSKLGVLCEVIHSYRDQPRSKGAVSSDSLLLSEDFKLRLCPPPSDQ
ncbi:vacuolar protein sorting-associated protein 8 homolog isoform X1 [Acanthaster planci]|uniref:Vacuolar protein sorting-associated protein 8 homolog isoform X1 n=1 Tax=Acanthaster planci TaxID=133434 RepID=A0A8B8A2W0_ACAPL|nr:vacuolar protein sorting-associated protein 8 homolog isoform X1 [Acanthaster planci]